MKQNATCFLQGPAIFYWLFSAGQLQFCPGLRYYHCLRRKSTEMTAWETYVWKFLNEKLSLLCTTNFTRYFIGIHYVIFSLILWLFRSEILKRESSVYGSSVAGGQGQVSEDPGEGSSEQQKEECVPMPSLRTLKRNAAFVFMPVEAAGWITDYQHSYIGWIIIWRNPLHSASSLV
jgi:hypothetical protein